jgi:DNA primase
VARIPEAELERLKREVSLQRLVEQKGVQLQRRGRDLVGRCPFHDDHGPSLVISPERNLWHCLGACQAGGSVVDWVMRSEGVSFRHAVELLRADLPAGSISSQPPVKESTVRRLPAPVEQRAEDAELLGQVVAYYQQTLKESPEALAYLEGRGLRSRELVERFQLGYANRTLGLRLPQKNRVAGADLRGRLQGLGIIRESGHEHFNGSLVVPIFDAAGKVVEMYGRKLNDNLRQGTPLHLYLPGPHRGVWNLDGLGDEVIVTEALIDAMTFWVQGYRNVTAAYGVEGFTEAHLQGFSERGVRKVLIAYDADQAGDKAAVQLALRLTAAGMDCYRVRFPKREDANSFALVDLDSAQRRLGDAIRKAVWLGQGKRPADRPGPLTTPAVEEEAIAPAVMNVDVIDEPEPLSAAEPPEAPTSARVEPPSPPEPPPAKVNEREVTVEFGERRWRVRGLDRNSSFDVLKVNLLVSLGDRFHVDSLDLYQARSRQQYLRQASEELGLEEETLKRDLGRLLLRLEELAEEAVRRAQEPETKPRTLDALEEREALELLRDPRLLERVLSDLDRVGVVGEETNKLVAYLAATSRKLDRPLAVIVQSTSAAGKSALMDAVLELIPEEDRIQFSAVTGQALYYLGEHDLEHKVLAIEEEQGAERAAYALKLLQSEGELSIASTGKDPQSGRLVTQEYRVRGPVAIFLTTT